MYSYYKPQEQMTDINYHDPEHKDITILYIYINFKHLCEGAIKTLPISITLILLCDLCIVTNASGSCTNALLYVA